MKQEFLETLIEYGKLAGEKGFSPGISGNMSIRTEDKVIITASGCANGYLTKNDFSKIDLNGNVISGNPKASSEKFLHIEFYKKRTDINAILHFHSPYLTAFASAGKALDDAISPEIVYCFEQIPLAKYALPGSKDLLSNTTNFFEKYDIILLENHGIIAGGNTVKDAYLKIELAEAYAKTILFAKLLGGAKILPKQEVEKIYELKK